MAADRYPDRISPGDLLARIRAGTAPAILDVRSRAEFLAGRVPGARHVPFWAVAFRRRAIPAAPDEPVVVYCGQGPRAGVARAALGLVGFTRVLDLDGHWEAWVRDGLPIEKAESP
jgi:rhodanese-related sulfurtransferase